MDEKVKNVSLEPLADLLNELIHRGIDWESIMSHNRDLIADNEKLERENESLKKKLDDIKSRVNNPISAKPDDSKAPGTKPEDTKDDKKAEETKTDPDTSEDESEEEEGAVDEKTKVKVIKKIDTDLEKKHIELLRSSLPESLVKSLDLKNKTNKQQIMELETAKRIHDSMTKDQSKEKAGNSKGKGIPLDAEKDTDIFAGFNDVPDWETLSSTPIKNNVHIRAEEEWKEEGDFIPQYKKDALFSDGPVKSQRKLGKK